MKKIFATLAVLAAIATAASAQNYDYDGFELAQTSGVDAKFRVAFPMYFGLSTVLNPTYNKAWTAFESQKTQNTILQKSFAYGIEIAGVRFISNSNPFELSLAVRYTFMDFALENTSYTYGKFGDDIIPLLANLKDIEYDGTKSKIHANYIGIPARIAYKAGKGKVFAGISADYCLSGTYKFKNPKNKGNLDGLFNPFRASVEAGFAYGGLGIFLNYGLTPLFANDYSSANTFTVGLTLGI